MLVIIGQKNARFVGQSVTPAICPGFEAVRNLQYFNKLGLICRFSVCPGFTATYNSQIGNCRTAQKVAVRV